MFYYQFSWLHYIHHLLSAHCVSVVLQVFGQVAPELSVKMRVSPFSPSYSYLFEIFCLAVSFFCLGCLLICITLDFVVQASGLLPM